MRRSLNLLTLGVTLLVVIAFVVPLGFLVRRQADQRGRVEAERQAQTLAALLVRATAGADTPAGIADLIGPVPEGSVVILPDGTTVGEATPDAGLVDEVLRTRTSLSAYTDEGFGVAMPVGISSGTAVVFSSVPRSLLNQGVVRAWSLLGLLGAGLVAAALFVSDRLGRSVVGPSTRIATAAEQLGRGQLDTRVDEEGPEELAAIASSFNRLATRIRGLLAAEREQVADLSHRLRTPLAAVRLQAEQLSPGPDREAVLDKLDRLTRAVDDLITEARRSPVEEPGTTDVIDVLRSRAGFWEVLAEEQGRSFSLVLGGDPAPVAVLESEAAAAFDALIGNVFSHTEPGVDFGLLAEVDRDSVVVEVADSGPGFTPGIDPVRRGASSAGSSGLGLDIVRRFAESVGGTMRIGASHSGGARVAITLPLDRTPAADE